MVSGRRTQNLWYIKRIRRPYFSCTATKCHPFPMNCLLWLLLCSSGKKMSPLKETVLKFKDRIGSQVVSVKWKKSLQTSKECNEELKRNNSENETIFGIFIHRLLIQVSLKITTWLKPHGFACLQGSLFVYNQSALSRGLYLLIIWSYFLKEDKAVSEGGEFYCCFFSSKIWKFNVSLRTPAITNWVEGNWQFLKWYLKIVK